MSDCVSKALVEASLPGEPQTYDARLKRSGAWAALERGESPGPTVSHSVGGESPRKVFETNG
jgi:hypothetical protein